jgi:hypothetical protein
MVQIRGCYLSVEQVSRRGFIKCPGYQCCGSGSGMGKKSGSGSEMNNPDHISESLETIFWVKILKLFDADPG